jgi:hypothetical protein
MTDKDTVNQNKDTQNSNFRFKSREERTLEVVIGAPHRDHCTQYRAGSRDLAANFDEYLDVMSSLKAKLPN